MPMLCYGEVKFHDSTGETCTRFVFATENKNVVIVTWYVIVT